MARCAETDLYVPVKHWLEELGLTVKAEIGAADVFAVDIDGEPIIVELKTGFSLTLLQQAVARQAVTERVYVGVPRWTTKAGWRSFKANVGLCRRLGVGVLSVRFADGVVEVHADPMPFSPRKSKARKAAMLSEFHKRVGDPNLGGMRGERVTAYRQDFLKCAAFLRSSGASKGAVVAAGAQVKRATRVMADNHYGWFERVAKGVYELTDAGRAAVVV